MTVGVAPRELARLGVLEGARELALEGPAGLCGGSDMDWLLVRGGVRTNLA